MPRLLLADRVKSPQDSFLVPLLPALSRHYDTRLVSLPPGEALAAEIDAADIVWLEWCWDHAVWATRSGALHDKPCLLRLHAVEALQTDYPARVDWTQVQRLLLVGEDIADVLLARFPAIADTVPISLVPNGIDLDRFAPGTPDRYRIGWAGRLEPQQNPMLLLQIVHRLLQVDSRYRVQVAGAFTDLCTQRYMGRLVPSLGLGGAIRFDGAVADMSAWYADTGVLLSTSIYESFGMTIGEAMAAGAFPVVHDFPGADRLWPPECLYAGIDDAVALIRAARPGLFRDWVAERYALHRQQESVLHLLDQAAAGPPVSAAA